MEGQELINEIRNFVEEECRKPTSNYGFDPFENHFIPVVKYCEILSDKMGADKDVCVLAGWLHDIGSIVYGRMNHHITSSEIAEKKLREFKYPQKKIEHVKACILTHRGSKRLEPKSVEAQILAEADAVDAFNRLEGLFMAAFVFEKLSQKEAKDSVRKKLQNKFSQLSEEGRELIKLKYEAAMLLLS